MSDWHDYKESITSEPTGRYRLKKKYGEIFLQQEICDESANGKKEFWWRTLPTEEEGEEND